MKTRIRGLHSANGATWKCRRVLSGLGFIGVVVLLGILAFTLSETALAAAAGPNPTITILVSNYAQSPPAILGAAAREAGRILREAGLRTVWLDCRSGRFTETSQGPCKRASEANVIWLRVLPAPARNQFQDNTLGFTVNPVLASVYYDYAVRVAKTDDAEFKLPIILGCVIAHELGHLLLGPNSHSLGGVMQAQWKREQVQQLMMGILLFTPPQSELMRAEARRRMLPQM
jgi:hypothetical protein